MNKAKALLNPDVAISIKKCFPVTRKRSALWFFSNEFKNDLIDSSPTASAILQSPARDVPSSHGMLYEKRLVEHSNKASKVSRNRILQLWRNMDPESKRKYFNMAEFDEVRYKEQRSLWVSEVGALLQKYESVEQVMELAPDHEQLQSEFLASLEKLSKNYEQMIQTESTKEIYKDAIKRAHFCSLDADKINATVPKHHEAILTRPRRPPAAFVLYLNDNMSRYKAMRSEKGIKGTNMRLAADEWATLDSDTKQTYNKRYAALKMQYDKAMEEYRETIQGTSDTFLEEASREKRTFKKSLRKRLRNASLLPLSIRNPFNFFLMEHRDSKLINATETWRNLQPEEKAKYNKLNEEDAKRYRREIESFNEIKRMLNQLIVQEKTSRNPPDGQ